MLILGKNKDYYDGVVGTMGVDKTIVYNRERIEVEEKKFPDILKHKSYYWKATKDNAFVNLSAYDIAKINRDRYQHQAHFVVGFCGKLYLGWKLSSNWIDPESFGKPTPTYTEYITYDVKFVESLLEPRPYYGNFIDNVNLVKNYDAKHLFIEYNTPVFVYDADYGRTEINKGRIYIRNKEAFIINPLLKDYGFYKVFDTFKAFQEIQMYIGGVLGSKENEIIKISDKDKINQHGFDFKWSFRKEKETKK